MTIARYSVRYTDHCVHVRRGSSGTGWWGSVLEILGDLSRRTSPPLSSVQLPWRWPAALAGGGSLSAAAVCVVRWLDPPNTEFRTRNTELTCDELHHDPMSDFAPRRPAPHRAHTTGTMPHTAQTRRQPVVWGAVEYGRVNRIVDLSVDVGISMPAMPSSTR